MTFTPGTLHIARGGIDQQPATGKVTITPSAPEIAEIGGKVVMSGPLVVDLVQVNHAAVGNPGDPDYEPAYSAGEASIDLPPTHGMDPDPVTYTVVIQLFDHPDPEPVAGVEITSGQTTELREVSSLIPGPSVPNVLRQMMDLRDETAATALAVTSVTIDGGDPLGTSPRNQILYRRGTAAAFAAANPVLGAGESSWETDTRTWKIGDGSTPYDLLSSVIQTLAAPTGNATKDTAILNAAHTALPAAGGFIRLPAGAYNIGPNAIVFTKPVHLSGVGGAIAGNGAMSPARGITSITSSSPTATALKFTAPGSTCRHVAVLNTHAAPTAGSGVEFTQGDHSAITECSIVGFYTDITMAGMYWTIARNWLYDPVFAAIVVDNTPLGSDYYDHCDSTIDDNRFVMLFTGRSPEAAIKWICGGGARIHHNKVVGLTQPGHVGATGWFKRSVWFECAQTTVDITITDNSWANNSDAVLQFDTIGGGGIQWVDVHDNQLNSAKAGSTCHGIVIGASSAGLNNQVRAISIKDNNFQYLTGYGIKAYNLIGLAVGKNMWGAMSGPALIQLADPAKDSGIGTTGVHIESQALSSDGVTGVPQDNIVIIEDNRSLSGSNNGLFDGLVENHYQRNAHISAVTTPVTLWTLELNPGDGVTVEVTVTGQNTTAAHNSFSRKAVVMKQRRALLSPDGGGGGTVTVSTMGTDDALGNGAANMQVLYSTSTANKVTVKLQTTDVTQCGFGGTVEIRVLGRVKTFKKGV